MTITTETVRRFAEQHLRGLLPGGFRGRFFLAGGCFKSLIHGRAPKDLDLWPASPENRTLLLDALQSQGSTVLEDGPNNTKLKNARIPFFVEVTRKCPRSIEESVADFDLELACVSAEYSDGRVVGVYVHGGVAGGIRDREVRAVRRLSSHAYSLRTLARLERYGRELGYRVCGHSRRRVWDIYAAASEEDRRQLLEKAGLGSDDVPSYASVRRAFVDGRPREPCRPFTRSELDALRHSLISAKVRPADTTNRRRPVAVYVVAPPGAGKSECLNEILAAVGCSPETTANLDMDHVRSFHGQFNRYIRGGVPEGSAGGDRRHCTVYKDLIPWFNEGSGVERVLYRDDRSIVRELLSRKADFLLPVHAVDSLPFVEYAGRLGYASRLVEVRAPLEAALERAARRARATGRYASPEYVRESMERMNDFLPALKEFVRGQEGGVIASLDNSRDGGGGAPLPVRIERR